MELGSVRSGAGGHDLSVSLIPDGDGQEPSQPRGCEGLDLI